MKSKMRKGCYNNPLMLSRVVGDILDPFTTAIEVRVSNHGTLLRNGCILRPSQLANPPRVDIGGDDFRAFYTLVMVDADYPNPSNPYLKEYLHWLVTDIPRTTGAAFGKVLVSYEKPELTTGIHRLVLVVFRQRGRGTVSYSDGRYRFNTREFAEFHELGPAQAALFFNGHRENGCGGRRLQR